MQESMRLDVTYKTLLQVLHPNIKLTERQADSKAVGIVR